MCPICTETLDQSDSPAATQIKAVHPAPDRRRRDAEARSRTSSSTSAGQRILAAPPRHGLQPARLGAAARGDRGWRRDPGAAGLALDPRARARASPQQFALDGHPLEPEEERRLDEELARFDWVSGSRRLLAAGLRLDRARACCPSCRATSRRSHRSRSSDSASGGRQGGSCRRACRSSSGSRSCSSCSEQEPRRSAAAVDPEARVEIAGFVLVVLGLGPGGAAAVAGTDAGARPADRPRPGKRLTGAARSRVRRLRRAVRRGRARGRSSCSPRTPEPWCEAACCSPRTRWASARRVRRRSESPSGARWPRSGGCGTTTP